MTYLKQQHRYSEYIRARQTFCNAKKLDVRYFISIVMLRTCATLFVSFLLYSLFTIMVIEKLFSVICLVGFDSNLILLIYIVVIMCIAVFLLLWSCKYFVV